VPHVVKVTLCRITPLHLWAHTTLKCLHVTPWAFVWEPKVSTPLDVVLCVYSFVVCSKHLLASDCRQLVYLFANAPGFFLFQASEFLHVWSSGSIAQTYLRCCRPHLYSLVLIVLLLPLPRGFSPYTKIWFENFIKLPFHMRELWLFHFSFGCCPEISGRATRPYLLLRTSNWLDSWLIGSVTS
jgi:hypothetical protein